MPYVFSDINYSALAVLGLSACFLSNEVPKLVAVDSGVPGLVGFHVEPTDTALTEVTRMTKEREGISKMATQLTISQS